MKYPSPSDYVEALQFPDHAFTDPELARGEVEVNAMGLPRVITGAYAAVFRVARDGRAYAVRCFLTESADRRKRYRTIASHLASAPLPFLATFDYQASGVRVGEGTYPIVKMPWLDGEPLDAFVERHLDAPEVLLALRDAWREMLEALAAARIAHGDLQHGNVLVARSETLSLRLVDYDAMWVPALAGRPSPEVGHRNYQHPDRTERDVEPYVDRFPGLVVYTALTALAEAPQLWQRFNTGENLLFRSDDFLAPGSSSLFEALAGVESARPLVEALRRACLVEPAAVPAIEDALSGDIPPLPLFRGRRRKPAPERVRRRARWPLPIAAFGVVAGALLTLLGAPLFGSAVLVGGLAMAAILSIAAYRRLPAVRRRHRLMREAEVLRQWITDLEDQLRELERERDEFLLQTDRLREERLQELQGEALERRLRHHFIGELSGDAAVGHRAVVRLKVVGIRTAHHATPERVAAARDVTPAQRAAIAQWRGRLADRYAEYVPTELSPVEERRMRRVLERRLKGIAAEVGRVRAKAALQRKELAHVEGQLEDLPEVTPVRYAAFALRLARIPEARRSTVR